MHLQVDTKVLCCICKYIDTERCAVSVVIKKEKTCVLGENVEKKPQLFIKKVEELRTLKFACYSCA